ncbi:ubiquitin-protein ligase E3A [Bacillus rossius redtenbacheri]|uniref:ubiquitin-protein ligase E3A n=1 Tax=Bacillus rossius redtenbacheri TaxID=93214 RepID=UPI002FDCA387
MNSKNQKLETGDGEASSASAGLDLPPRQLSSPSTSYCADGDTMKRASAKKLIERYFYQLVDGCGNENCDNEYCASSGKLKQLTRNQAAAQAIQLFSKDARLCDAQPTKVARTQSSNSVTKNSASGDDGSLRLQPAATDQPAVLRKTDQPDNQCAAQTATKDKPVPFLTEERLLGVLETCRREDSYSLLIRTLGEVYSSVESLSRSFPRAGPESPLDALLDRAPCDLHRLKKEDVRTLEGEPDKDEDSKEQGAGACSVARGSPDELPVSIPSLRRAYHALFQVPGHVFESALVNALTTLAGDMDLALRVYREGAADVVAALVVVAEIPVLGTSEYLERALPYLCKSAAHLPLGAQARLARLWARHSRPRLQGLLEALQQLVTLRVISGRFTREYCLQDEEGITAPTKLMKILYYANILAGELDPPELRHEDTAAAPLDDTLLSDLAVKSPRPPPPEDPLAAELGVSVLDSRRPLFHFAEFYNEPLSDAIEMDKDFACYKSGESLSHLADRKFSFMNYAFVLTPATKTLGLYYDNRIRMYSERRMSFFNTVVGQPTNPYLRLKVRRDHIIEDALVELEMVAMENPKDLKKQLVVEFDGEQGIDEGGVSKEFFQLIVEEIFNPDYGMFTVQEEMQTVWFNPTSFESNAQFTLIGIVIGLAIYNNIILDIHFPMVVYKKLLGKQGTFWDLEDFNQALFTGLKAMLDYEQDDMEDTFMQTFRICCNDVFGSTFFHDLKEGGDHVYVTQDNKKEFVDLYADFLINTSVDKQFRAFRRGFQMVTDESPLHLLFRPEEVEQLVCGSKNFDFNELEEATEYDGGYASDSQVIRFFWDIVHKMALESKRKLLQFATGSDRVPVGGLSKLKLIIARNGPDSDRLPTAHTCFNVLLLPEYDSREKLHDRLMKAINYSKGFGML